MDAEARARIALLEDELNASEERFRTVVESLPFDFWMIDASGRYVLQNETSRRNWGVAVGKLPAEVAPTEAVRALWLDNNRRVMAGETIRAEVSFKRNGEVRTFLNVLAPLLRSGTVAGLVGVNIDVTDGKRLAQEVQRTQRLAALGELAGGIAHDFNNLLMAILGSVQLARTGLPENSAAAEHLSRAEQAYTQARALTRQLLTFAKGGAPVRGNVDLGSLLREAAPLAAAGSPVRAEMAIDSPLPAIVADSAQIGQVVHNLVLNAVQAMPAGGVVRVSATEAAAPDDAPPRLRGKPCVRLRVADTGPGIDPEALPRIFDPYFTTKPGGHGLGLALVHSIVERHDGYVRVSSEPGAGATFDVYLPASTAPAPALPSPPPPDTVPAQRILVLDDEPFLRKVIAQMLRDDGHTVVEASTAEEAIRAFERASAAGQPFTLVGVDLTLSNGPGGLSCLAELRKRAPDVRAIVVSGYSTDPVLASPQSFGFNAALEKPFTHAELVAAIARALR